jgi:predicted Zn-dependent peptidase
MSTVQRTTFPNGLTLVTERVPELRSLSMGVWVRVGTRHERSSEAGMSHFLEHMLFKGTEHRTAHDIAREVDRVGGEFNAFTTREYTCFHLLLLDRDFELGLEILRDILLHSIFDAAEMERERKVILQEIAMVDETPEELAQDLFFECVYGRHGLGKSILGSESSIRRLSRAELIRFFRKHYSPDQIVLAVAGNATHAAIKKRVQRLGRGHWWGGKTGAARARRKLSAIAMAAKERVGAAGSALRAKARGAQISALLDGGRRSTSRSGMQPPRFRHGTWWISRKTEQAHIVWGVEGPRHESKDRVATYLLNTYLGGGMSSLLFQEIREKHALAYTVYSSLSPFVDSGIFSVYAATSPARVTTCLKLIEDCMAKLSRELLSEEQLEEIKDSVKGGILLSDDSMEARMSSMGRSEVFREKHVSVEDLCAQIDRVTPKDIRRIARSLTAKSRSVLVVGPKPTPSTRRKLKPIVLKR